MTPDASTTWLRLCLRVMVGLTSVSVLALVVFVLWLARSGTLVTG